MEQFQSSSDKPISIVLHKPVEVANAINQRPMKVVDTVGHQTLEVARQPLEVVHQPHQPLHGDESNLETGIGLFELPIKANSVKCVGRSQHEFLDIFLYIISLLYRLMPLL